MAKQYIRTDKNGTKIYHDYTCQRCGGKGVYVIGVCNMQPVLSPLDSGVCWGCGGSGKAEKPQVIKEYTPEYRAKLDAQAEKRREKKMAQARIERIAKQAEWKLSKGFVDERIYVVSIENSFDKKDLIKAAGGRYNEHAGWYFSEPHEEFETVEITAEEALDEDGYFDLFWRNTIRETVKAKAPKPLKSSEHIGKIGDKLDLEVKHLRTSWYDTHFGTTFIHTFEDEAGNILVWKTSSCGSFEGDNLRLKGTIKEHDEYRGIKQTVLTRCRIL